MGDRAQMLRSRPVAAPVLTVHTNGSPLIDYAIDETGPFAECWHAACGK